MNLKMKIYSALTSASVKSFVHNVESFCAENLPTVNEKILLPAKFKAKSLLLQWTMEPPKKDNNEITNATGEIATVANEKILVDTWKISKAQTEKFAPLISVIVPNFNHEKYLRQRLETVYSQTYKNFEVILLDDLSADNSLEVLREFQERHKNNTRLIANEKNSGNVFKQWRKGIEAARGQLIWIAESDDYSQENFLAELVSAFRDETIKLAFVRTDFIQDGVKTFDTENYLSDINSFDWKKNFAVTAADFVANAMAIKNVIPNVSSVVFRKPSNFRKDFLELWHGMKLCGDWLFYLEIMKGGCIYYTPAATNFYRVHQNSTSLKIQKEIRYYEEHERIAEFAAQNYNLPLEVHTRHLKLLEEHYLSYFGGKDKADVAKYFRLEKIQQVKRRQNILMSVFSMSIGGGETFPLILANELHLKGYPVTVLDFQMAEDLPEVRKKLLPDIPFVRIKEVENLAEVVKKFQIDIIHTHHGSVDEAATFIPNVRHVVTLHGMYEATVQPHLNNLLKKVQKHVNAFVYIADKNLQPFIDFNWQPDEHFFKIGNGLERFKINPVPRQSLNIPAESFVCCVVSRAIPEKGWLPAINAVELANKTSPRRIDLILVGAGEMYDKLQGKVSEFVHLMGFKSNVRDYLAAADIGLLPSEFAGESFPLLIIDSLFSGRPVVSSNLGEVTNMLKNSDGELAGIVFDLVNDKVPVETLSEILKTLANNPEEYEKISARVAEVAEKFDIETVAEKYIEVYNFVTK